MAKKYLSNWHAMIGYGPDEDEDTDRGDDVTVGEMVDDTDQDGTTSVDLSDAETTETTEAEAETETTEVEAEVEEEQSAVSPYVPKTRFNAVNEKYKTAAAELEKERAANVALRAAQATATAATGSEPDVLENQLKQATEKFHAAIEGNDREAIVAAQLEISKANTAITRRELKADIDSGSSAAVQNYDLNHKRSEVERLFPQLAQGNKVYDADLVSEVDFMREGFIAKGLTPAEAYESAVFYATKASGIEPRGAKVAGNGKSNAGKGQGKAAAQKAVGLDTGTKEAEAENFAVETASDEAFAALPESTKAQLRGDFA